MKRFGIWYDVNNHLGFDDEEPMEVIEGDSLEWAEVQAFEAAVDELDSYGGLHGYPCSEEFEEWEDFLEEANSWVSYQAKELTN